MPIGSNFPKEKKLKRQTQASSPWSKKCSPMKQATSSRSNEFFFGKGLSSLRRAPSLKTIYFPKGKGQVPRENICYKSFCNHNYFMIVFI